MINLHIFLQANGMGGLFAQMWPLILIIIVFWFFIMRPQAKRQKEQQQFLADLDKGDEVVTTSGIYGRINKIEGNIVTLQVDTKTFIRVAKSAVSREMTDASNSADEKSKQS